MPRFMPSVALSPEAVEAVKAIPGVAAWRVASPPPWHAGVLVEAGPVS